ncbi:MAG: hypothetical protein LIP11_06565 [Clostridiales bacterium]|nr:hypothetical protein [Clostridiales bacterium]
MKRGKNLIQKNKILTVMMGLVLVLLPMQIHASEASGTGNSSLTIQTTVSGSSDMVQDGKAEVILSGGTTVATEGDFLTDGLLLVVEPVTESDAADFYAWISGLLQGKGSNLAVYNIYFVDSNGNRYEITTGTVTATIYPADGYQNPSVYYVVTDGTVTSLGSTTKNGAISFVMSGIGYYALLEAPEDTSGKTEGTESGDASSGGWKHGLVLDADEVFRYYQNNVFAEDYVGVVPYDGSLFFIKNGLVDFEANGLCLYEDVWYFVSLGQVQLQYTGLALYDSAWFYVTDGILDTTQNGLVPYDGERFLVVAGKLLLGYNGLWLYDSSIGGDGCWYFLAVGMVQNVSQVVLYDGEWFVVENGILDSDYNGTIEYDGEIFNVVNGQLHG